MITWIHIGDLHIDATKGFPSLPAFQSIVAEINHYSPKDVNFVYLPGDNANFGEASEYAEIMSVLESLTHPYRVIPGDHDFHHRNLDAYQAAFGQAPFPIVEPIANHRCIFLDIVSAGLGGPDFRMSLGDRNRLTEELATAAARGETPLVFMHAYPGDLAADGDSVAQTLADGHVAFVDTGHTHFNEILNDDRVLYGAVRSTGEIEEGGAGYAIVTVRDGVVSWRFRELGDPKTDPTPLVQIVAPSDLRLVTRPADERQVPRPGPVEIVAKLFGPVTEPVTLAAAGHGVPMTQQGDLWSARIDLPAGLHCVQVMSGTQTDEIDVLVRPDDQIPKRRPPIALGRDAHAIGAWPSRGIDGAQRGPNKNGRGW